MIYINHLHTLLIIIMYNLLTSDIHNSKLPIMYSYTHIVVSTTQTKTAAIRSHTINTH